MSQFSKGVEDLQKNMRKVSDDMKNVGTSLTAAVTVPLVGIAAASLKTAGDFEFGMNKVKAITQSTGKTFDMMRDQAVELGRTTQFTAKQASEGMGFLAMAGFKANEIVSAMPSTLQLAASAALDLGTAADITSNILTGYGLAVEELGHANDVLVGAFTSTNVDLTMLGEAFKYVGPIAKGAGVNFEEAAAAIGLLGNAGIQGSMAGTTLRNAIINLLNPTKEAKDLLEEYNIEVRDSSGEMMSLTKILAQFEGKLEDVEDLTTIFGKRAGPGLKALLSQGSDALREQTELLESYDGIAERVAKTQMEGFHGAMLKLKSAVEGTLIAIGDALIPFANQLAQSFTNLAGHITKVAEWFNALPGPVKAATISFAGLAAAAGPLLLVFGHMVGAVANLKLLGPALSSAGTAMASFARQARTMGVMNTAVQGLGSAVKFAIPGLIAFGAALVAIEVVKTVDTVRNLVDALSWSKEEALKAAKASGTYATALETQEDKIKATQKAMADFGEENRKLMRDQERSERVWGSLTDSWSKLKNLVLGPIGAYKNLRESVDQLTESYRKLGGEQEFANDQFMRNELGKILKRNNALMDTYTQNTIALWKAKGDAMRNEADQAKRSAEEIQKAQDKAAAAVNRTLDAWEDAHRRGEQLIAEARRAAEQIVDWQNKAADIQKKNADLLSASMTKLRAEQEKGIQVEERYMNRAMEKFNALKKESDDLAAAYERLGIKSTESFRKAADQAEADFVRIRAAVNSGRGTMEDMMRAYLAMVEAQVRAGKAMGDNVEELEANAIQTRQRLEELGIVARDTTRETTSQLGEMWKQVSTIFTDMSSGIADAIWGAKDLGDVFSGVFEEMGKALTRFVVEQMTMGLIKSIYEADSALQFLGQTFQKVFGGLESFGSSADAVKKAAGGGGGGGLTGIAGELMGGPISAISGITNMVTGILGFFQGRRMEKDIGRIEVTTREIKQVALDTLDRANEFWPALSELKYLGNIDTRALAMVAQLELISGHTIDLQEIVEEKAEEVTETIEEKAEETKEAVEETTEAVEEQTQVSQSGFSSVVNTVSSGTSTLASSLADQTDAIEKIAFEVDDWNKVLAETGFKIDDLGNIVRDNTQALQAWMGSGSKPQQGGDPMQDIALKQLFYQRHLEALDLPLSEIYAALLNIEDALKDGFKDSTAQTVEGLGDLSHLTEAQKREVSDAFADLDRRLEGVGVKIGDVVTSNKAVAESVATQTKSNAAMMGSVLSTQKQIWEGLGGEIKKASEASEESTKAITTLGQVLGTQAAIWEGLGGEINKGSSGSYNPGGVWADLPWNQVYPQNNLTLNVQVNNADAQKVADSMVTTWRKRGVDI